MSFILCLVLLAGCRKPDPDLGLELLPGDPLGVEATTTPVKAFSFVDGPIRTTGLTRNLVGSYVDPQFGRSRAGIVTQIRLSSANVGAGMDTSGLQADSLVLSLAYDASSYGYGGLAAQHFRVFEVAEPLSVDSLYETDDVPEVVPVDLVTGRDAILTPRPLMPVQIGEETMAPQLRIKLDRALAERFMDAFGTPILNDNNSFLDHFRGLYITVDNGEQVPFQQGILYFDLLNAASKVTLYYHDAVDMIPRTYDFPINENSVRYTVAEFDRSTVPVLEQALNDSTLVTEALYLQALGGPRIAVRLPDVMELAQEGQAISRAELIVPVQGTFNPYLPPPGQIFLFRRGADGEEEFLPDQLGGIGSIDGVYRTATSEYRFNITRYVQHVLAGTLPNNGFELVAGSSGVTANRVVLRPPGEGMRLALTFTTY